MTGVSDKAISFEAALMALMKTKDGMSMKLIVHPNDLPRDLMIAPIGTRYVVALVQLNDADEPVDGPDALAGKRAVASAGMLSRNPNFRAYLKGKYHLPEVPDEEDCIATLHDLLSIDSRAELATDEHAREVFNRIVADFQHWMVNVGSKQAG